MTHELKTIFESFLLAQKQGVNTVLATVVDLDGSSYRKPGVRMLIWENGHLVGAVSGGCVEKEVVRQTSSVFNSGISKVMTYDGRYRLGCEGVLYILLESFNPQKTLIDDFFDCLRRRQTFEVASYYINAQGEEGNMGSAIKLTNNEIFSFSGKNKCFKDPKLLIFKQKLPPLFKLIIIGAEHDAVELCLLASLSGWEVVVVSSLSDPKTIADFPGASEVRAIEAESFNTSVDKQTAVVLMTHNYAKDLKYLTAIKDTLPAYIGLLGARDRKEKIIAQFLELQPEANWAFIESIHGPAGLNIGAITPQEIAVSIISEILAVHRKQIPELSDNKIDTIQSV